MGFLPALLMLCVPASAETARDIAMRALQADTESAPVATKYTYQERTITKDLDSAGHVRKTTDEVRDILFLGGKRHEHLIEKNGKPLPPDDAKKEQAKIDKAAAEASRLTPAERDRRFEDYERERAKQRDALKPIPDAYDFILLGEPRLEGREYFLIQANPRPNYRGKYGNLLRNMRGKIWIERPSYQWARVEIEVLDDVSFGLFLAKLSKGAQFALERTRVNNEVWLPKYVKVKMSARALMKKFRVEEVVTYSNYKKFSTDARMAGAAEEAK